MKDRRINEVNENVICNYLLRNDFSPALRGFDYLKLAIVIVKSNSHRLGLTTEIYPRIAQIYGVTATKVERCIRHSVWKSKIYHGMTNGDCIYRIALEV